MEHYLGSDSTYVVQYIILVPRILPLAVLYIGYICYFQTNSPIMDLLSVVFTYCIYMDWAQYDLII